MISILEFALVLPATALLLLAAFFALETAGSLLPLRRVPQTPPGPIAVVVPAHEEEAGIRATVEHLKAHLRPGDRLIVVADNCRDRTAQEAKEGGAEVLERDDPARRGKGFALQYAIDELQASPPAIVVFIDADCRAEEGAVLTIAAAATATERPVQALYLMKAPEGAPPARRVAEFAWLLMNRVRMGGLYTLFDVSRLTGSGMAAPFALFNDLNLASAEIVEDLALGLVLTERGAAPVLCADAAVSSFYPSSDEASVKQRARWEHGSLALAFRRTPQLLMRAIETKNLRLAAAALDLAVPPLTLFAGVLVAMFIICAMMLPAGVDAPFHIVRLALGLFALGVLAGWAMFGRAALPLSVIAALGPYLRDKVKVYGAKARASASGWQRTDRDGPR